MPCALHVRSAHLSVRLPARHPQQLAAVLRAAHGQPLRDGDHDVEARAAGGAAGPRDAGGRSRAAGAYHRRQAIHKPGGPARHPASSETSSKAESGELDLRRPRPLRVRSPVGPRWHWPHNQALHTCKAAKALSLPVCLPRRECARLSTPPTHPAAVRPLRPERLSERQQRPAPLPSLQVNRGFAFSLYYALMNVAALACGVVLDFFRFTVHDGFKIEALPPSSLLNSGHRLFVFTGVDACPGCFPTPLVLMDAGCPWIPSLGCSTCPFR
jgi:hypothetical protein